ncbi:hypothetical protein IFM47457_05040 [Aspergillus lentulus]|nr:hypothetical protein IFM47457_05040 [Aspergillus lentulus]
MPDCPSTVPPLPLPLYPPLSKIMSQVQTAERSYDSYANACSSNLPPRVTLRIMRAGCGSAFGKHQSKTVQAGEAIMAIPYLPVSITYDSMERMWTTEMARLAIQIYTERNESRSKVATRK